MVITEKLSIPTKNRIEMNNPATLLKTIALPFIPVFSYSAGELVLKTRSISTDEQVPFQKSPAGGLED
ncbi:MAG: hypothetical protein ACE5FF_08100 [Saprospiraceae bacterium]